VRDTTSKYARYCAAVAEARLKWPEWRRGQAHFNVLYFDGFDPEYADEIRGTDLDPFHSDAQVERMLPALARRWRGQ
jgi:hypothetical protein